MYELDFNQIGKRIKERRVAQNMTQECLAECIEINTSHISNIENNRVKVSLTTLVKICNVLDTTVDYILANEYNGNHSALNNEIIKELEQCSDEKKEKILKIIRIL